MPNLASLLEHLERQVPDKTGSVDRNSNICQRDEESHDVDRRNMIRSNRTVMHLSTTNCQYREQEEVRYQGRRDNVHREIKSHEVPNSAIPAILAIMLRAVPPWRYHSQGTESIQYSVVNYPGDEYWDMEGKEHNDICVTANWVNRIGT